MWEPFQIGSEPQPLHHCVICSPAVNTRISAYFPNAGQHMWR